MLFNSIGYLIFLPVVLLVYYAIPRKVSHLWLLAASYFFYMCWNPVYSLLMLSSTVITYSCGLLVERADNKRKKKAAVLLSLILNLGILFYFKYSNFITGLIMSAAQRLNIQIVIPQTDVLLPVGISFYTFQALGYTIDVYRNDIAAERNFFRYALFVSFFPQLVAGPIERSGNLLSQLKERKPFSFDNFREGILLILWGLFLKMVLADRIAIFVDKVYGRWNVFQGWYLVIATILFGIQIYCDFFGYSTIATGSAKMLGIQLMENFDAPYLSTSVAQFWRRWHISLTSWFRDYLYIPLGGNKRGKWRKNLNRMIVFLVSGLWHGANITFVVWGALNGLYQTIGDGLKPVHDWLARILHINRLSFGHRFFCGILTFLLISFSWIFFRAQSMEDAFGIVSSIFTKGNIWKLFDGSIYKCGLNESNFWLMVGGILILIIADCTKRKGLCIRAEILKQGCLFRWGIIILAVLVILVFGIWGPGYDATSFIYFQF